MRPPLLTPERRSRRAAAPCRASAGAALSCPLESIFRPGPPGAALPGLTRRARLSSITLRHDGWVQG